MKPFARVVLEPAHGVLLTSATLTDRTPSDDVWASAIQRSGAAHVESTPLLSAAESPFDYATRAEVLIVTDVAKGDLAALAGAYGRLIEAAPAAAAARTPAGDRLPPFLPAEARAPIALIQRGGPFPHRQDGSVFGNREQRLPPRPRGYYHEYTVDTPGAGNRGARRIVTGGTPPTGWFYTDDHYETFRSFDVPPAGSWQ